MDSPKAGARVTLQPSRWHDGTPVEGWPRADMLGTVKSLEGYKGSPPRWARVKWDTGRTSLEGLGELHVLSGKP